MNDSPRIRVMIVDDHDMVRRGLGAFLRAYPDLQLVGEARSGQEALELCAQAQPDVILMDLVMPEMDGITATRLIIEKYPKVQIIALTSFQEQELVRQVLQAGAISYLLKNVTAADLHDAIRGASIGHATLAPEAIQALIQTTASAPTFGADLTEREREVLALMAEGLNNPGIAERLIVSRSTVKAHVSNILGKLGASSRAEALALAFQHKLIH
jgi:NarL family two-component system response regulator LiaR